MFSNNDDDDDDDDGVTVGVVIILRKMSLVVVVLVAEVCSNVDSAVNDEHTTKNPTRLPLPDEARRRGDAIDCCSCCCCCCSDIVDTVGMITIMLYG
jgi:hypothetical protein